MASMVLRALLGAHANTPNISVTEVLSYSSSALIVFAAAWLNFVVAR